MKICKVKIVKNRGQGQTEFQYPTGYDPEVVNPFCYQNEGVDTEYCLATVPDNFTFTADMVELNQATAEGTVDTWIDDDKDISAALVAEKLTAQDVTDIKTKKRAWCVIS